jgi:hypothetical protein
MEAYRHHDTHGTLIGSLYGVEAFRWIGWGLVSLAVALTIVRGLPVVFDAYALWGKKTAPEPTPRVRPEDRIGDGATRTTS